MRKQTSLYIPKPCHEDWNNMTHTQQGKFCGSCNKQVIDFSLMSDNQVLQFLSQQQGKLCGRFDADQLQRPLIETKISKKKSWWMALAMPFLFLFDTAKAQKNIKITGDTIQPLKQETRSVLLGKIAPPESLKDIIVKGKLVDENDKPIANASVFEKGRRNGIATDSLGNFSINIDRQKNKAVLIVSSIGFQTIEKEITANIANTVLQMKLQPTLSGEIVVVGYATKRITGRLGGISSCTKITIHNRIDSTFKKMMGISNVYPNPAQKGSIIHVKTKAAGNYQMQLLDNRSRLMQTEEIITDSKNATTQIQLQSTIASGVYYMRMVDEQTHKSTTEKIIIQ